jgi:hypothetical protein
MYGKHASIPNNSFIAYLGGNMKDIYFTNDTLSDNLTTGQNSYIAALQVDLMQVVFLYYHNN